MHSDVLSFALCLFYWSGYRRYLHSFPTRRSSDLSCSRTSSTPTVWTSLHPGASLASIRRPSPDGHEAQRAPDRDRRGARSEEHTSELQSQSNLVCRLLLDKKK